MVQLNRANGQTFVMVTHSLELGERAHRIVRMRDGFIVDDGNGSGGIPTPAEKVVSSQKVGG